MQPKEAIGRALPSPQAHSCQQTKNRYRVSQDQRLQDENAGLMPALHSTFAAKPQKPRDCNSHQRQTGWFRHWVYVQVDERLMYGLNLAGVKTPL